MLALRALARSSNYQHRCEQDSHCTGVALLPLLVVAGWRIWLLTVICPADAC